MSWVRMIRPRRSPTRVERELVAAAVSAQKRWAMIQTPDSTIDASSRRDEQVNSRRRWLKLKASVVWLVTNRVAYSNDKVEPQAEPTFLDNFGRSWSHYRSDLDFLDKFKRR